jgi:hypothetical protein
LTVDEDYIDFQQIMYTLNTSIVKGTPRWSQRSYSVLYDFWLNGIVLMMGENALKNVVLSKDDWRTALMAKITEWTQENESAFIPIVAQFDRDEPFLRVPSIADLIHAEAADLPHLYLLHPLTESAVKYPEALDDMKKISPEVVLAWASQTVFELEVQSYEDQLALADEVWKDEEGNEHPNMTPEQKQEVEGILAEHKDRLAAAKKELADTKAAIAEKNEFAENIADHLEVSESHMTRIE